MRHRPLFLVLLLAFRVFFVPVSYAVHADEIRSLPDAFEHFRLKKRRSSYLDDAGHSCQTGFFALLTTVFAQKRQPVAIKRKKIIPSPVRRIRELFTLALPARLPAGALYLRNRVLRV